MISRRTAFSREEIKYNTFNTLKKINLSPFLKIVYF